MTLSSRFLSNLLLILAASFLVVATQSFAPITVAWLTFGISIGVALVSLWLMFGPMTIYHRVLGGVLAALSAWAIVASLVFAASTVLWLGFGVAVAYGCIGVAGLFVHELTTERIVHSLEVGRAQAAVPEQFAA